MPSDNNKKRRRPKSTNKRQLSLSWPQPLSLSTTTSSSSTPTHSRHKRARTTNKASSSCKSTSTSSLWTDQYAPQKAADLAVAPQKVQEVREFLQDPQNAKLLVLVGSPGVGKSTTVLCLARELNREVLEWRESVQAAYTATAHDTTIAYESALTSFEQFLQTAAVGYTALALQDCTLAFQKKQSSPQQRPSLVLLQDLPYCHTPEARARLRQALTNYIAQTTVPTVLIYSDVKEGKHQRGDLERLMDPTVLYTQWVRILTVPAPTKARFAKCLQAVARAQGLSVPSHHNKTWTDAWHATSGGDLRHALLTLQLDGPQPQAGGTKRMARRDQGLTAFHALGKLLYAKRDVTTNDNSTTTTDNSTTTTTTTTTTTDNLNARPPLNFDPEDVVGRSGMEVSRVLDFVRHNGPSFFTEIDELADAWQRFSDAALWLQQSPATAQNEAAFPVGYATSVTGRTVAYCNRHPTAGKFRELTGPPSWTTSADENWTTMEQHWERQADVRHLVGRSTWAPERVAYQNVIAPHRALGLPSFLGRPRAADQDAAEEMLRLQQSWQAEILRDDDIKEFPEEKSPSSSDYSPTSTTDVPS